MAKEIDIFFQASDPFGLTGWSAEGGPEETESEQLATALGPDGDVIATQGYDQKTELSCNFIAKGDTATIPTVGAIMNGWHIDNISISWSQTSWPKLSLTAHKHDGTAHDETRKYAPSISMVCGFGCPTKLGPFALGTDSKCGVRSMTYSLKSNHVDELNSVGNHLAGDDYDGTETLTVETTGPFDFAAGTDDWHLDSSGKSRSNTAATTSSATYTKHIAHVAEA